MLVRAARAIEQVTTIPVLLGAGRPLFGALPDDVALQLRDVRHWPFGFVPCRWGVLGQR